MPLCDQPTPRHFLASLFSLCSLQTHLNVSAATSIVLFFFSFPSLIDGAPADSFLFRTQAVTDSMKCSETPHSAFLFWTNCTIPNNEEEEEESKQTMDLNRTSTEVGVLP